MFAVSGCQETPGHHNECFNRARPSEGESHLRWVQLCDLMHWQSRTGECAWWVAGIKTAHLYRNEVCVSEEISNVSQEGPTTSGKEEPELKSPPLELIGDSLYHLIYYKLLFSIQSFPNLKLYIHSLWSSFQSGIRNPMWVLQEGLKKTSNLFHFLSHTRTEPLSF